MVAELELTRMQVEEMVQKLDTVVLVFHALADSADDPERGIHAEQVLWSVRRGLIALDR